MNHYLLYAALHGAGNSSAEFDTVEEVVEAVSTLVRNTFEEGHQMVTFSVGDISETVREEELTASDVKTPEVAAESEEN